MTNRHHEFVFDVVYSIAFLSLVVSCLAAQKQDRVRRAGGCTHSGCPKFAAYGDPVARKALFCSPHKLANHILVRCKKCMREGCSRRAVYGPYDTGKALMCSKHRIVSHTLIKRRCETRGCRVLPSYAPRGAPPLRCAQHRFNDDHDVVNVKCAYSGGCDLRPNFGSPEPNDASRSSPKASSRSGQLFCARHRPPHYVDVKSARCRGASGEGGCGHGRSFGNPADGSILRCSRHRREGDQDLKNSRGRRAERARRREVAAARLSLPESVATPRSPSPSSPSAPRADASLVNHAARYEREERGRLITSDASTLAHAPANSPRTTPRTPPSTSARTHAVPLREGEALVEHAARRSVEPRRAKERRGGQAVLAEG